MCALHLWDEGLPTAMYELGAMFGHCSHAMQRSDTHSHRNTPQPTYRGCSSERPPVLTLIIITLVAIAIRVPATPAAYGRRRMASRHSRDVPSRTRARGAAADASPVAVVVIIVPISVSIICFTHFGDRSMMVVLELECCMC
jgi:hypothetical protein